MDQWIKDKWESNKLVFFLLLPILLIILFKDLIMEILIGTARKQTEATKAKDEKLKDQFDTINDEANALKKESDNVGKQSENIPDDEDWNKKRT
jgi:hypothetical protein